MLIAARDQVCAAAVALIRPMAKDRQKTMYR
jgi:hypothetical protein